MIYLLLFYEFFKVGLFAIGGGLVTVPFCSICRQNTVGLPPKNWQT